jgi:predicted  nucleic acid-binding Zn-ribbon protein
MAEPFDTLMRVQEYDTSLDQLRHRADTLPARAELHRVRQRRSAVATASAEVGAQVEELRGRQQSLEEQIASTARRRHEIERRMESGQVSSSRDLQAMDHEVHQLGERMAALEEEELALLEEQEPLDVVLEGHRSEEAALAAEVSRLEAGIAEEVAAIDVVIATEAEQRAEAAAGLPEDLAERYERLRAHLGGVGAARLVGDHCDGCHLSLSAVELERIHHLPAGELATCPECDRLLVH